MPAILEDFAFRAIAALQQNKIVPQFSITWTSNCAISSWGMRPKALMLGQGTPGYQ
jgi:hypothetical protein